MLKKLLRYDLKPIFKYWWIAALSSFIISILGGGCVNILQADPEPPDAVSAAAIAGLILILFCNIAFTILSEILVYLRYYRNLYTDEGYLTFTLPAKKATLINSKLLMSIIVFAATLGVLLINACSILLIGFGADPDFWKEIAFVFSQLWMNLGFYLPLYIVLGLILMLAAMVLSTLVMFCIITISSIIVKKARVFCAIALCYLCSGIFSSIVQFLNVLYYNDAFYWLNTIPQNMALPFIAFALVGAIAFTAALSGAAYLAQYAMVDRKLNLA